MNFIDRLTSVALIITLTILLSCSASNEAGKEDIKTGPSAEQIWGRTSDDITRQIVSNVKLMAKDNIKPIVLVGKIESNNDNEINARNLEFDIELSLMNTGQVTFINSKKERDKEREIRKNRTDFGTVDEFYNYYKKFGVDYFIDGLIDQRTDINSKAIKYDVMIDVIDMNSRRVIFSAQNSLNQ